MSIAAGQVVDGKYRVVKLLGQGGMGAVYLAEHMIIGKRVALKVLLGNVAGNDTAVARFEREAQAAGRIGNDHILEIFDFGSLPDGARFMVCEFLEGETLASRLTREVRLSPAALVPIARQLLSGLGAAHHAGVVHRDLKPENVFILNQKAGLPDFVKIIDFGISKFQPLSTGDGMQMTATGIVVGTPCYLSPEQARGSREADARSDLYAVGVILYECVTGTLPFDAQNVNDLLFKIVLESPRPLREAAPDLDPAFGEIIEIAMARDPDQRFQAAALFIAALDQWAAMRGLAAPARSSNATPRGVDVWAPSGNANVASGAARSLAPTPGTWADSHVSVNAFRPQRRKGRLVAGGLLAAALVAGGAFALFKGQPSSGTAASAASIAPPPSALVAPSAVPPLDAVSPPSPPSVVDAEPAPDSDFKIPPVSTDDVNALLEPPPSRAAAPARAFAPPKRTPAAAAPNKGAAAAPPAPSPSPAPAETTKRHRDYGY